MKMALQNIIATGSPETAIRLLSDMNAVEPEILSLAIQSNPDVIPYIVPKTTVTSDHMFQAEGDARLERYLASKLSDREALDTFMLALETQKTDLASIVLESRQPDFLETVIMLDPDITGVIEYLRGMGLQTGVLYAALVNDIEGVKRLIKEDKLDYILNLALNNGNQEIVDIVMDIAFDPLTMLYQAINNSNMLAVSYLIESLEFLPDAVAESLVRYGDNDQLFTAMSKLDDDLQEVAEVAASVGNLDALKILLRHHRAVPSETMMIFAVLDGNRKLQEFLEAYVPLQSIIDKFNNAL